MTRILLHIGQPKTGSSALQRFFANNREVLRAKGIGYYAALYRYDPWSGNSNADYLLALAARRAGIALKKYYTDSGWENRGKHFEEWFAEEASAFSAYTQTVETVILSEEWLWGFGVEHSGFWQALRKELETLCPDATVDVVCYLRLQDEWLLSKWKEDMQNEIPVPLDLLESMADYEAKGYFNYETILEKLAAAFGREHLFVRSYDRRRFPQGSISADFMQMIDPAGEGDYPFTEDKGYASISFDVATALCQRNKRGRRRQRDRYVLYHAARTVSTIYKTGDRVPEAEREALRELLGRYSDGNRRIAERYTDAIPLFLEKELRDSVAEAGKKPISLPRLQRRITLMMIRIRFRDRLKSLFSGG